MSKYGTKGEGDRKKMAQFLLKRAGAFNRRNPVATLLTYLREQNPGEEFVPLYDGTNRVKCVRTGTIYG